MYQEAEVRRGMALLDEKAPGWRNKFDPPTLDMADVYHCVLGQVYGYYTKGFYQVFGQEADTDNPIITVEYGFSVPSELWRDRDEEFDQASEKLADTWVALVSPPIPA